jgi:hypothetical protein
MATSRVREIYIPGGTYFRDIPYDELNRLKSVTESCGTGTDGFKQAYVTIAGNRTTIRNNHDQQCTSKLQRGYHNESIECSVGYTFV